MEEINRIVKAILGVVGFLIYLYLMPTLIRIFAPQIHNVLLSFQFPTDVGVTNTTTTGIYAFLDPVNTSGGVIFGLLLFAFGIGTIFLYMRKVMGWGSSK